MKSYRAAVNFYYFWSTLSLNDMNSLYQKFVWHCFVFSFAEEIVIDFDRDLKLCFKYSHSLDNFIKSGSPIDIFSETYIFSSLDK